MASSIQELLNRIQNAIYGREVRGSIHDAIEMCYDDVTEGKTIAEAAADDTQIAINAANAAVETATTAANTANDAAGQARSVLNDCRDATENANTATANANTATSSANTAVTNANAATANAEDAATAANAAALAATDATTAATNATTAATNATTAATIAANDAAAAAIDASAAATTATNATANANSKASAAQTAANNADLATTAANLATTNANTARDAANTAASAANTAASTANAKISDMNDKLAEATTAIGNATTATTNAIAATTSANTASDRANAAALAIESVTASSFDLPYNASASVTIQTDPGDGHKNFYFGLRQGNPGPGFTIKGDAYATLSDLEADVVAPEIGDCYNVGTEAPYHIYRWTGTIWEDQGFLTNSLVAITPEEVQYIQNGGTVTPEPNKALGVSGLTYMLQTLEVNLLATKVDKVTGKSLSTNDFTNAYKDAVDALQINVSTLQSGKVDKVTGKGLSTNDFTTAYKDAVDSLQTSVASLQTGKVDKVTGKDLSTNDFTNAYKDKLDGIAAGATAITVDSALSGTSSNPVQNSVIKAALDTKQARHKTASASVSASSWNSSHQATVAMTDVTASNDIDVRPGPESYDAWVNAGVRCTAQADGSITLTARTNPTVAITVQALIWD